MKATGIVRRIDDLGRVVIPKEIRRTLRIREGDPLEIFTDRDGGVILKKYSPISELAEFSKEYAECINQVTGNIVIVCDRDEVICISGGSKKDYYERKISNSLEQVMDGRNTIVLTDEVIPLIHDEEGDDIKTSYSSQAIAPIVANGDSIGVIIIASKDSASICGDSEKKLLEIASNFLGKQMES